MLAVWSFVGAGVTDYLLFIVSGFILARYHFFAASTCPGHPPRKIEGNRGDNAHIAATFAARRCRRAVTGSRRRNHCLFR